MLGFLNITVNHEIHKSAPEEIFWDFLIDTICFLNNFTITQSISLKFGIDILERLPSLCTNFYQILLM